MLTLQIIKFKLERTMNKTNCESGSIVIFIAKPKIYCEPRKNDEFKYMMPAFSYHTFFPSLFGIS